MAANSNIISLAEQRRQRASTLKQARNYKYAANAYLKELAEKQEAAKREATIAELQRRQEQKDKENQNFFVRALSTVGDIVTDVISGAVKGLEGIYDLGAGIVGAVGGIFSSDFQKSVQDHIAYDWTTESFNKALGFDELDKWSYTQDWGWFGETLNNVASGVGQMLPAIAINLIPGAGQAASIAMLSASAAGSSTEQAYKDGASYWGGLGYGAVSGVVEAGTEMLGAKLFGASKVDELLGIDASKTLFKPATSTVGKIAQNMVSEGLEEATTEFVNPLLQNIYKDKGFFEDFLTTEHLKNIGNAAATGAFTSLAFGETVGRINRSAINIQDNLHELETLKKKIGNLQANNKLDNAKIEKAESLRKSIYEDISKNLTSLKPEARTKLLNQLERYGVQNVFNSDGTLITEANTQTTQESPKTELASYNKQAYSYELWGKEQSLAYKPTQKALTDTQIEARKTLNSLNKGKIPVDFVITGENLGKDIFGNKTQSKLVDGVLYLSESANAIQEVTQYGMVKAMEGTKAYNKYAEFVLNEIAKNKDLQEAFGDVEGTYKETVNKYTESLIKQAEKRKEKLNAKQRAAIQEVAEYNTLTNMVAKYTSENIFNNPEAIARLAENEPSVLKRFASWVKDTAQGLSKGSEEKRSVSKFLQKAEKLYRQALEESFGGVKVDNNSKNNYNIEKGDSNGTEQRRAFDNDESEKWSKSKDTSEQTGRLQEESRESGQGKTGSVQEETSRRFGFKELVAKNVKVKAVKSKLDFTKSELDIYNQNKAQGLETVFYDGSATPLNQNIVEEDAGYDGFVDIGNKTVYLRSDKTVSATALAENNRHENLHFFISQAPEAYTKLKEAIFKQLTPKSKSIIEDRYGEAYFEVYNGNIERVYEEIVVDLSIGREQGQFVNVDIVNDAIKEFYASYSDIAKTETIKPYKKIKNTDTKYTVAHDSEGNPLTAKQNDYFKDSKVRNENGNLLVVYHGTNNNDFTVFDINKSKPSGMLGQGFYFTESKAEATDKYSTKNGRVVEAYLNITNPLYVDLVHKSSVIYKLREHFKGTFDIDSYLYNARYRDRVDTKKMLEIIRLEGYDGIINKEKGYYVAFDSNQIKETTNMNPTINDDIRYVINKNKEIRDLVVVHNLSERKLLEAIDLGGLAVPSIAITKDSVGHENFGEISLIFKSDTIDPSKSYNKVYESDVYSKRFPQTVNKISSENLDKLLNQFKESAKIFNMSPFSYESELSETNKLNAVETLKRITFVKYQFLKENGVEFEIKQREKQGRAGLPLSYIKEFADNHKDLTKSYYETEFVDTLLPEITKTYNKMYSDYGLTREKAVSYTDADRFLFDVGEYNKNGTAAFFENDIYSLREAIDAEIKNVESEFNSYIEKLVDKYYDSEKYFRNNVDLFTNSGNRRSFNALYDEANLYNIVKYMTGRVRNEEGFNYGAGSIRSILSQQFKTIKQIKEASDKIVDSKTMEKLKEATDEATFRIAGEIAKFDKNSNSFMATDNALDFMAEIARSSGTESRITALFEENYNTLPSKELIKDIQDYMKQLKNYPTEYFEAKPQRAVYFDEVVEVIAPVGTSARILDFFNDKGIKIELYDHTTTGRSEIIKGLPEDIKFTLSKGQLKKEIAKGAKLKVYNRNEAAQAIDDIMSLVGNESGSLAGVLKGATKEQLIDKLWIGLNTKDEGFRSGLALEIADYILDKSLLENTFEDYNDAGDIREKLKTFASYMHKIDLDGITSEIEHKYDKHNGIKLVWHKKGGLGIFDVANELFSSGAIGQDLTLEHWNDADLFFAIIDEYQSLKNRVVKKETQLFKEGIGQEEYSKIRNNIAREVLLSYDKYGSPTRLGKVVEKYQKQIKALKNSLEETRRRNKAQNSLFETVDRLKGLTKYQSAEIELAGEVTMLINELKKVKTYRGNLSKHIRSIMANYSQEVNGNKLYNLLSYTTTEDNPLAKMIEDIAHGRGDLSTAEIQNLDLILRNFIHNVRNYDRVFFEGRNQSDTEIASQAVEETKQAIAYKDEGFLGAVSKFSRWLQAPVWRFERLGGYRKNSIMTKVFNELKNGVSKQAMFNMEVAEHYKEFFEKNKKTVKSWNKQTIEIGGVKMSKGQIIDLYMLSKRKQAQSHLFNGEDGLTGTIQLTNEEQASRGNIRKAVSKGQEVKIDSEFLQKVEDALTATDREFIELTETFFNKIARDAKHETDMALYGISNAGEDYYIPIRVSGDQLYSRIGDTNGGFGDLFSVYSPSFNKDVKPNANNKIVVENIIDVVNRHTKQMAAYYGLAMPIKSFNRIYNKKLEDGSKLSTELAKVDAEFEKYVNKLFNDMQGKQKERSSFDAMLGKVRSLGAKAALGLNLKVLANQFVSLPASAAVGVKYKNIMKGFGLALARKTDFDALVKYAPMLYDRFREGNNIDVGLLKEGKGVLGKVDVITDLTTAPIGKIDQFICGAVWNACLEQTKSTKYENYSEEHYKAAAKLTEEAVIKTQANYTPLYRPAVLREQSSFLQLSTMFMSEPLQQFSLLTSAIDKIAVARKMIKSTDTAIQAEGRELMKVAKAESTRAIAAVFVDTIILTLIAQAFRWLKGTDDEDEDVVQTILQDFAENYIGMIPFAKDIYSVLQGYDVTNMAYSGLTNIANGLKESWNIVDLLASGKSYDEAQINGKIRKTLLGISQTFGIPLRNLETYSKGIIEKFAPEAVYKYDKFFYDGTTSSYAKELNEALAAGDDKMADTILDLFLTEEKIPVKDATLRSTLKELYAQGFNVLPRSVGKSITYDGEQYALTQSQRKRFREVYQEANEVVKNLTNKTQFKDAEVEIQAKAIEEIYDYYYKLAIEDLLGVEVVSEKDRLFYKVFNLEDLVLIIKQARALVSDKDEDGKTISGSKKRKIQAFINRLKLTAAQKYMIMGYLGYKNSVGLNKVKVYIQSQRLSKAEKEALLEYSGYEKKKD